MEIDSQSSSSAQSAVSGFKKLSATESDPKNSFRRIGVPPHRYSALKASWVEICEPVVKQMKLQIRMNPKRRCIEIKTGPNTEETGAVQRASVLVCLFCLFVVGFSFIVGVCVVVLTIARRLCWDSLFVMPSHSFVSTTSTLIPSRSKTSKHCRPVAFVSLCARGVCVSINLINDLWYVGFAG